MMKFFLYVILGGILLTFPLVTKAQLCPAEVSTDPRNPSNPDRPEMENTFYWFPHNGNDHNSFEIITSGGTYPFINSPFWNLTTLPVMQLVGLENSDFYPKDGWELLKVNFGKLNDGTQRSILPSLPYMALYNKYTGTIRFLGMWPNASNSWQIIRFKVSLPQEKLTDIETGDQLEATNLLSIQGDAAQPLDQKTKENVYEIITEYPGISNASYFFWFDLPVAYDPCICKSNVAIKLEASVENNWDVTVKGVLDAQVIQQGTSQGSNHSNLVAKRIIGAAGATATAIATGGAVINTGAFTGLLDIFTQRPGVDDDTKAGLELLQGTMNAISEVTYDPNKLQWRNTITGDTLSRSDWNKLFSGIGSFLNTGVDFLNPSAKAGKPRTSVVGTITASGTAILNDASGDIVYWGAPGSKWTATLDETVSNTDPAEGVGLLPEYPIYNYPLGTFALLKTPVLQVKFLGNLTMCEGEANPFPGDSNPVDESYWNPQFAFFFDQEELLYSFNPTLNINEAKTKIMASLIVEEDEEKGALFRTFVCGDDTYGSCCPGVDRYSLEKEYVRGKNIYIGTEQNKRITPPVPLEDINEVVGVFLGQTGSDDLEFKYFIRFQIKMVSNNIGRDGKPISNVQIMTFPLEPVSYNNPTLPKPVIDIENDQISFDYLVQPFGIEFLSDGEKLYSSGNIEIETHIQTALPSQYGSVLSASVIHLNPGTQISPSVHLGIGYPFLGNFPQQQVSSEYVASFCNNQIPGLTYQANQFSARATKLPPIPDEVFERYSGTNKVQQVVLHPNPANSHIWVTASSTPITEVEIFDLSGRSLIHQKVGDELQRVKLDIHTLQSGVYIVQTRCGDARSTLKLVVGR